MSQKTIPEYIAAQPQAQQQLLNALHQLVKNAAPHLQESIKWGMPSYGGAKNICYLAAQKNHVNLGFYEGSLLADPHGLLDGTGAKMRHVKIRSLQDMQEKPLAELILRAAATEVTEITVPETESGK